jgi:hypothetical protein
MALQVRLTPGLSFLDHRDGDDSPEEVMGTFNFPKTNSSSRDEDDIFKERIKNMGKSKYPF